MNPKTHTEFFVNPSRLNYSLDLYKLSKNDLIKLLNSDRKRNVLTLEKLNKILNREESVNKSFLNKFARIFGTGLTWLLSKRELPERKTSSIFFRKDSFNSYLNLESKKRIAYYEELKSELEILCKQIDFKPKMVFGDYKLSDNPENAAKDLRKKFDDAEKQLFNKKYISKANSDRDYLINLIRVLEHFNLFVFEFTDRNRKPEKIIKFDGFFMLPHIIVLKRQQKYIRREIWTLLHEFAHYLLKIEEIDENTEITNSGAHVEKWCNHFTYSFLINGFEREFSGLIYASKGNNYYKSEIGELYKKTHLSEFALYTRLKTENKISESDYNQIKEEITENIRKKEEKEKIKTREKEKIKPEEKKSSSMQLGKDVFIAGPKEIRSKLFEEIIKINFFKGNMDENQLRQYLGIKPEQDIDNEIY
ncbi:MAG: hypothetical protein CVT88_03975 [Candidatus Altiarchaeales archaeon HGW-Altiarchaeales-1]|nr:MAG: hypothetical protein CVT88_03975 [Candidatus Altiarchaeales archaeon HGW-Altiarchaeales-1]